MKKLLFFILYSLFFAAPAALYAAVIDLTTSEIKNGLVGVCRNGLGNPVEITMLNGDVYKMFTINSSTNAMTIECFNMDVLIAKEKISGLLPYYSVVMVYDLSNNTIRFPGTTNNANFPAATYKIMPVVFSNVVGMYNGVPVSGGSQAIISIDPNNVCSDGVASGSKFSTWINFGPVNGSPSAANGFYVSGWGFDLSPCLYRICLNGGTLSGYNLDSSACCTGGCPANQYGDGCTCTDCPTMVNKAGQTVSGTSDEDDNIRIGDCTMGTSHVFSDASGDWSFQPACPASN